MTPGEVRERVLTREEVMEKFLSIEGDPSFRSFPGKIEVNQYGELLMNAASRLHVVVQNRLKDYLERQLGGEAMTEMPIEVPVSGSSDSIQVRVPDLVWSADATFFEGPVDLKVLSRAPALCVEVKSDGNTLKETHARRDELLAAGAQEVWFVFPEARRAEFYCADGERTKSAFDVDLTEFWKLY